MDTCDCCEESKPLVLYHGVMLCRECRRVISGHAVGFTGAERQELLTNAQKRRKGKAMGFQKSEMAYRKDGFIHEAFLLADGNAKIMANGYVARFYDVKTDSFTLAYGQIQWAADTPEKQQMYEAAINHERARSPATFCGLLSVYSFMRLFKHAAGAECWDVLEGVA